MLVVVEVYAPHTPIDLYSKKSNSFLYFKDKLFVNTYQQKTFSYCFNNKRHTTSPAGPSAVSDRHIRKPKPARSPFARQAPWHSHAPDCCHMPQPALPPLTEAQTLHQNLGANTRSLCFSEPLETHFREHLYQSQRTSALFTTCALLVIWLFYIGLDMWRLNYLQGSIHAQNVLWGTLLPRFFVLTCFACAIYSLLDQPAPRRRFEFCVVGSILTCALCVPVSTYTIKNTGMTETSMVLVLITCLIFFPFGVRLRIMGPLALVSAVVLSLSGPFVLYQPEHLKFHWVLTGVVWVHLLLSAVTAYHREVSLREQFLLRRLLDWEATHDPLTGLANRRMFHEHMARTTAQARRYKVPLFLVIMDIDHFKLYNDRYGHGAGDAVLRQCAVLLQNLAQRPLDLAVRLGGEEFGLIVYDMRPSHLGTHLAQLQRKLTELNVAHAASPTAPHVTISMGGALVLEQDTAETAFQRADALLYQAKNQGRNQACLQTNEPFAPDTDIHLSATTPPAPPALPGTAN